MPNLSIETKDREKPIIIFLGNKPLVSRLIKEFTKDFKIAYVTNETVLDEEVYQIKKSSLDLIGNLDEDIDYAILYPDIDDRAELPALFNKLEKDKTKTIVLIDIKEVEKFYDFILLYKGNDNIKFLFVGQIYEEKDEYFKSEISSILYNAIKGKTVNFAGSELKPIFPIYIHDAITGISQVLFSKNSKSKFYYLFYSHPQTLISAVHIITRVEPDLEVKYERSESSSERTFEDIEQGIRAKIINKPSFLDRYFEGFEKSIVAFEKSDEPVEQPKTELVKISKKVLPPKKHVNIFARAFATAFALFIVFNFVFIGASALQLKNAANAFENNEYERLFRSIKNAEFFLSITEPTIKLLAKTAGALGIRQVEASFDKASTGINLLSSAGAGLEGFNNISAGIDRQTLDNLMSNATYIYFRVEEERATSENETLNAIFTPDLSKMASIAQIAPNLLGFEGEKNYLILFQNNGELRPTGGFIGSVGEAKVIGGQLVEFNIQDVYEYDGQLKAHIEPHYIIRRYLQPHLYLRDSNFDPDFQKSAGATAAIFKLITEREVDGVIAVNFEAVREIIKEIGPINLQSHNEIIDESNAFDFLQQTIDDNFFPGSSAKKDVLQALYTQLTLKLENDRQSFIKLARIIPKLANEKNILFSFNTTSIQSAFSANGYSGELKDFRLPESSKTLDFLAINEANIGVNKANVNIQRETAYDIEFVDGKILSATTHTIFNGNSEASYKAYLRFIVPAGSRLSSIIIDGARQETVPAIVDFNIYEAPNFTSPTALEVENGIYEDYHVFGFIIDVNPNTNKVIKLNYENGTTLSSSDILKYSLLLIKQPGTLDYPFTLKTNYSDQYTPNTITNARLENGNVIITDVVKQDLLLEMDFIKR